MGACCFAFTFCDLFPVVRRMGCAGSTQRGEQLDPVPPGTANAKKAAVNENSHPIKDTLHAPVSSRMNWPLKRARTAVSARSGAIFLCAQVNAPAAGD